MPQNLSHFRNVSGSLGKLINYIQYKIFQDEIATKNITGKIELNYGPLHHKYNKNRTFYLILH